MIIVFELILRCIVWFFAEIIFVKVIISFWRLVEKGYEFVKYRWKGENVKRW
ncbi:hypothetical protein WJR50_20960 [Catalinimonas sp. 4WD22]|uniref:hypothetical protein n=1 Tax=Catalinimonas locisalis TaxID=3133978 RepID=UPI0031014E18